MHVTSQSGQAPAPRTDGRLLLLDARDNVLVTARHLAAGETVIIEGQAVAIENDLPIGHKLARCLISAGDKIVKYGAPIGSATAPIAMGAHVHVHNVRSDYTPTYHFENRPSVRAGMPR